MFPDRWRPVLVMLLIAAGCAPANDSKQVMLARGRFYISKKEYDKAVEALTQGTALWPDSAEMHYECGVANERLKNLDRALREYDAAIELKKSMNEAHNNRATVLALQKKFDAAVAGYSTAIRLNPRDAMPRRNRGLAHHDLGKFDEAIQDFDDFARLDPASPEPPLLRGKSLLAAGRFEEARVAVTKSIRIDPLYAPAWISRSEIHSRLGDERRAESDLRRAEELKPKPPKDPPEKTPAPAETAQTSVN